MAGYDIKAIELSYFLDLFVHLNNGSFGIFEIADVRRGESIDIMVQKMDVTINRLNTLAENGRLSDAEKKHTAELGRVLGEINSVIEKHPEYGILELHVQSYDKLYLNDDGAPFNSDFVRAAVFTDPRDGAVFFTLRGTGDGRWVDNAQMMIKANSQMQEYTQKYFDFVMENSTFEPLPERVVVTGHSKGGNDAEYIMISSRFILDYAKNNPNTDLPFVSISMNGPGFSKAAIKEFEDRWNEAGVDPNKIRNNMTAVIGENDYVNWFGNRLTPPENVYVIKRKTNPAQVNGDFKDFGNYHAIEYMELHGYDSDLYELVPAYKLVNGEYVPDLDALGPLGVMGVKVNELQMKLEAPCYYLSLTDDEREKAILLYEATTLSIMSIMEYFIGGGRGLGDVKFASEEQLRLFFKEGWLQFIEIFTNPDNADMVDALATEIFFTENSKKFNLPPELAKRLTAGIFDLLLHIPEEKIANVLVQILLEIERDDLSLPKILKVVDMADVMALIPYIAEWGKDNPDLILDVLEFFGIDTFGLSAGEIVVLLDMLSFIAENIDPEIISQILQGALTPDGKLDFSKIDWNLLIDALLPEQFASLINKYLPELLKSVKDNPELLETISKLLSEKFGIKVDPDTLSRLLGAAGDLLSRIPDELLASILLPLLRHYVDNGEINFVEILNTIDIADVFKVIPYILEWNKDNPNSLKEFLDALKGDGANGFNLDVIIDWIKSNPDLSREIFGELMKWAKENPEYAKELGAFICSLRGWPEWAGRAIAPLLPHLPENELYDFVMALASGNIITKVYTCIKLIVAALKKLETSIVNKAKQEIQKWFINVRNKGKEFIRNAANKLFETVGGLFDAGIGVFSGISSVVSKFGTDVLSTLKETLPPQFSHIFDRLKGIINAIDSAVQKVAELAKEFLQLFKEKLKSAVDTIISGAKKAENALNGVVTWINGKMEDAAKSFENVALNTIEAVGSNITDGSWDGGVKYVIDALLAAGKKLGEYTKTVPKTFGFEGNAILAPIADFFSNWSFKPITRAPTPSVKGTVSKLLTGTRMALKMNELQQLQKSISDLINIWQNTFRVSQESHLIANNACRDFKQQYVHTAASEVRSLCSSIDNTQVSLYRELTKINDALLQSISGYRKLEASFA